MSIEHVKQMVKAGRLHRQLASSPTIQGRLHRKAQAALREARERERQAAVEGEDGRDWGPASEPSE